MNQLFPLKYLYLCLLYAALALFSVTLIVIAQLASGRVTFPTSSTAFDPAIRGFPETVYGYPVLAVVTPSSAPCLRPNKVFLILQISTQNRIELMRDHVYFVLERRVNWHAAENIFRWEVRFEDPTVTRQQVIADYRRRDISCIRLGGPIILACPRDEWGLETAPSCS